MSLLACMCLCRMFIGLIARVAGLFLLSWDVVLMVVWVLICFWVLWVLWVYFWHWFYIIVFGWVLAVVLDFGLKWELGVIWVFGLWVGILVFMFCVFDCWLLCWVWIVRVRVSTLFRNWRIWVCIVVWCLFTNFVFFWFWFCLGLVFVMLLGSVWLFVDGWWVLGFGFGVGFVNFSL